MAVSLALIVVLCLFTDWLFRRFKVPGLVGMLLVGVLLGPKILDLIAPELLAIGLDLRMIALVVILLRAGLELGRDTLHRVGRLAFLLSFIPAVFEGAAVTLLAPPLLGLTRMEAAMLGAIIGAVSPAVVVPLMINFIERRKGAKKGIPTLVLAASSIDDVFVIVVFSVLLGMHTGEQFSIAWKLAGIPLSILVGIAVGLGVGGLLWRMFERFDPRATKRVLILIGVAVLMVDFEHKTQAWLPFAALVAVMAVGFQILEKREHMAHELSAKLAKIWVFAEIILFTMVGAQVDIAVALRAGGAGALLIAAALAARSLGGYLCMLGSGLNWGERTFVVLAYIPKATVQAAIGAAPLAAMSRAGMDTRPGETILAVAVLSIILTAPLGAWLAQISGERFLTEDAGETADDARRAALESRDHND